MSNLELKQVSELDMNIFNECINKIHIKYENCELDNIKNNSELDSDNEDDQNIADEIINVLMDGNTIQDLIKYVTQNNMVQICDHVFGSDEFSEEDLNIFIGYLWKHMKNNFGVYICHCKNQNLFELLGSNIIVHVVNTFLQTEFNEKSITFISWCETNKFICNDIIDKIFRHNLEKKNWKVVNFITYTNRTNAFDYDTLLYIIEHVGIHYVSIIDIIVNKCANSFNVDNNTIINLLEKRIIYGDNDVSHKIADIFGIKLDFCNSVSRQQKFNNITNEFWKNKKIDLLLLSKCYIINQDFYKILSELIDSQNTDTLLRILEIVENDKNKLEDSWISFLVGKLEYDILLTNNEDTYKFLINKFNSLGFLLGSH